MFLRKSLHDTKDRKRKDITTHLLPAAVTEMLLQPHRKWDKERDLFLLNKALFMSLFAFDVILLSVLYVTIVLMAK
jgi:hypothetical protein